MTVEAPTRFELRDERIEAFLYQLYNRILRFAKSEGLTQERTFKPQEVFPWQEVEGREYSSVSVPFDLEGGVLFTAENRSLGVVIGRGHNGLVRTGRPLRILFGGYKFNIVEDNNKRGRQVDVGSLASMVNPWAAGGINGEFYLSDEGVVGINCWADSQRYGGDGLRHYFAHNPEAYLGDLGLNMSLGIVKRTIQEAR